MTPVAELVAAATYQRFVDHVEETERVYHDQDPGAPVPGGRRARHCGGGCDVRFGGGEPDLGP